MNEHGCVSIKLYLWTPKFEFHIVLMCHEILFSLLFSTIYKVHIISGSWVMQNQVVGGIWPMGHS